MKVLPPLDLGVSAAPGEVVCALFGKQLILRQATAARGPHIQALLAGKFQMCLAGSGGKSLLGLAVKFQIGSD
jgi:hypothetical protein